MKYVKLFESWINEADEDTNEISPETTYKKELAEFADLKKEIIKISSINGAQFGPKLLATLKERRSSIIQPAYKNTNPEGFESLKKAFYRSFDGKIFGLPSDTKLSGAYFDTAEQHLNRTKTIENGVDEEVIAAADIFTAYELSILILYTAKKYSPEIKKLKSEDLNIRKLIKAVENRFRWISGTLTTVSRMGSAITGGGESYFDPEKAKAAVLKIKDKSLDKLTYDDIEAIVGFSAHMMAAAATAITKASEEIAEGKGATMLTSIKSILKNIL